MSRYGHFHGEGKANNWTHLNATGAFFRAFLTNPWGLAVAIDNIAGFDPEVLGVSQNGLIIGSCLSTLFAICGTYVHKVFNTRHQEPQAQAALLTREAHDFHELKNDEKHNEDGEHAHGIPDEHDAHGHRHSHGEHDHTHTPDNKSNNLRRWQSASVRIDFIDHNFSTSTKLTLALQPVDFSIPKIPIWVVQIVIHIISAAASKAEMRTCSHNMEEHIDHHGGGHDHYESHDHKEQHRGHTHAHAVDDIDAKDQDHDHDHEAALLPARSSLIGYGGLATSASEIISVPKPDVWTCINVPIEFVIHLVTNVSFFGQSVIDTFFSLSADQLGLSWYGLIFGGVIGLWAAVGATHQHYTRNLAYQSHSVSHALPREAEIKDFNHPKFSTFISIPGDKIAHFTNFASPFINTLRLALPNDFPLWANILISLAIMALSAPISRADSQTCQTIAKKFKYFITTMNEDLVDIDRNDDAASSHSPAALLTPSQSQLQ